MHVITLIESLQSDWLVVQLHSLSSILDLFRSTWICRWKLSSARSLCSRLLASSDHCRPPTLSTRQPPVFPDQNNICKTRASLFQSQCHNTRICVRNSITTCSVDFRLITVSFSFTAPVTYKPSAFQGDLKEKGDSEHLNYGFNTNFIPNYMSYESSLFPAPNHFIMPPPNTGANWTSAAEKEIQKTLYPETVSTIFPVISINVCRAKVILNVDNSSSLNIIHRHQCNSPIFTLLIIIKLYTCYRSVWLFSVRLEGAAGVAFKKENVNGTEKICDVWQLRCSPHHPCKSAYTCSSSPCCLRRNWHIWQKTLPAISRHSARRDTVRTVDRLRRRRR